jgi:hypothetical protein
LVEVGELRQYDDELKEAWDRFFLPAGDDDGPTDEQELAVGVLQLALASAGASPVAA